MGKVTTYGAIAKAIGFPGAARAVGQALGANPNPIVVPCHRVVRSDGVLGGYSGGEGPRTKSKLLAREGVKVTAGKVDLDEYLFADFR
jgi:methylated-DNA-[protein]-cysteine S-methyltransferase